MYVVKTRPIYTWEKVGESLYSWLTRYIQELESCFGDYCFVIGHHPILSNGIHGPTPAMVQHIMPIIEKYHIGMIVNVK